MNIKVFCPHCNSELYIVKYNPWLKILKDRSWYFCKKCKFECETDKFTRYVFNV